LEEVFIAWMLLEGIMLLMTGELQRTGCISIELFISEDL